jgi:hypothetical protein
MRENGVMVPNRASGGGGGQLVRPAGTSVRDAFEKCRDLMPGERRELGKADRTKLRDAAVAYAHCMRVNGFEMPDPAPSLHPAPSTEVGEGGGAAAFRSLFGNGNTNDPAFSRADKVCRPALRKTLGIEDAHR